MPEPTLRPENLVLYKNRPARITGAGDRKIDIQTENGDNISVRPKDVTLLHPGPLRSLRDLKPLTGPPTDEVTTAWELLAGETTTLPELAELAYDTFTPETAWAVYQLIAEGLYFSGEPEAITVHTPEKVAAIQTARQAKAAEEQAWQAFLTRCSTQGVATSRNDHLHPDDERYLGDVAALALGERDQSRVLRALGREETPQNAHALLLTTGYWMPEVNPYPRRMGMALDIPQAPLPSLAEEPRRDLTDLLAFAIDDEDSRDPDDAISWDGERLWVHVADVAALVPPDSEADLEARSRGATLYLPEGAIPMLPLAATTMLGLGLAEISPALSFGMVLDDEGAIVDVEIVPSWVRVTRLTYVETETRLAEPPFQHLDALMHIHGFKRLASGAIELKLPEVKIRANEKDIVIKPLPLLRSRDLVREAMLIAGVAVVQYAQTHNLAIPYSTQEPPQVLVDITDGTLSSMFAQRRQLKPAQQKSTPGPHTGLGLGAYTQVTSPLRRYGDLLTHQQLRAHLRGDPTLDTQTLMMRMAEASAGSSGTRRAERLSNTHWKLVYLLRHPDWTGEGVVVEKNGARNLVLIPELELESEIYGRPDLPLDGIIQLGLNEVNLAALETKFRVLKGAGG